MKLELEIKLYDDAGQLISKKSQELLGLPNRIGMGGDSGYGIPESQGISQAIEKAVIESQAKHGFFKM